MNNWILALLSLALVLPLETRAFAPGRTPPLELGKFLNKAAGATWEFSSLDVCVCESSTPF